MKLVYGLRELRSVGDYSWLSIRRSPPSVRSASGGGTWVWKGVSMGGMYHMQDLLKLIMSERAEELRLEPGRPPIMVLHGKARVMDGGLVTSDDIAELFHSIASDEQNQELTLCGDSHFLITSEDSGRFKIAATTKEGQLNLRVMNLTR